MPPPGPALALELGPSCQSPASASSTSSTLDFLQTPTLPSPMDSKHRRDPGLTDADAPGISTRAAAKSFGFRPHRRNASWTPRPPTPPRRSAMPALSEANVESIAGPAEAAVRRRTRSAPKTASTLTPIIRITRIEGHRRSSSLGNQLELITAPIPPRHRSLSSKLPSSLSHSSTNTMPATFAVPRRAPPPPPIVVPQPKRLRSPPPAHPPPPPPTSTRAHTTSHSLDDVPPVPTVPAALKSPALLSPVSPASSTPPPGGSALAIYRARRRAKTLASVPSAPPPRRTQSHEELAETLAAIREAEDWAWPLPPPRKPYVRLSPRPAVVTRRLSERREHQPRIPAPLLDPIDQLEPELAWDLEPEPEPPALGPDVSLEQARTHEPLFQYHSPRIDFTHSPALSRTPSAADFSLAAASQDDLASFTDSLSVPMSREPSHASYSDVSSLSTHELEGEQGDDSNNYPKSREYVHPFAYAAFAQSHANIHAGSGQGRLDAQVAPQGRGLGPRRSHGPAHRIPKLNALRALPPLPPLPQQYGPRRGSEQSGGSHGTEHSSTGPSEGPLTPEDEEDPFERSGLGKRLERTPRARYGVPF